MKSFLSQLFCVTALLAATATALHGAVHVLRFKAGEANATINANSITLDSPALNGKATLKPIITQYWQASAGGVNNPHPTGVYYVRGLTASAGRWTIYNEDAAPMPTGAQFNVLIATNATKVDATPLNSTAQFTAIPTAKGKPGAILLFTHAFSVYPATNGGTSVRNQAISFNPSTDPKNTTGNRWRIFNQDGSNAAVTSYFIYDADTVPAATRAVQFRHTTSATNSADNVTRINVGDALGDPAAIVFIVSASDTGNTPHGVFHSGATWGIFRQDETDIGVGEKFNILMFPGLIP